MGKAKLTNEEVLTKGLRKARAAIIMYIVNQLVPLCKELLAKAVERRDFIGFSGNTQTSYMCLIYVDASVAAMVTEGGVRMFQSAKTFVRQSKFTKPPLRVRIKNKDGSMSEATKVPHESRGYLENPYEGKKRSVYGMVDVNQKTGEETSKEILNEYVIKKDHIAIVMTTGTEYSEYLEELHHVDVLSGTYVAAFSIVKNRLMLQGSATGSYFDSIVSKWSVRNSY